MSSSSSRGDDVLRPATAVTLAVIDLIDREEDRRKRTLAACSLLLGALDDAEDAESEDDGGPPRVKRTRHVFPRADHGASAWATLLRSEHISDPTSRAARRFRRRFRVPRVFFVDLVNLAKHKKWFSSAEEDVGRRQCIPVELKILAALQVLGRGYRFEDVSRMALMSESTAQASFHTFCRCVASELYEEHVSMPTGAALEKVMHQYDRLGFTGAVGSTDVTHIRWGSCPSSHARAYTGRGGLATIAYQVTVDHSGRALAVSKGFAGAANDRTILRYDLAVQMVREDPVYRGRMFSLYNEDGTWTEHKGVYLLVENGHHQWAGLMPPTRYPGNGEETRWSKTLASVRKHSACFFGTLKGRFRILKLPVPFQKKDDVDNVFFACCTIHNMLHSYGGLGELEENADWAGSDGLHDSEVSTPDTDHSSVGIRRNNGSRGVIEVESAHKELKRKLIAHYAYRRTKKEDITWLT